MKDMRLVKKRAYELACSYERQYGSCPQCVLAALKQTVGDKKISEEVFQSASGFGNGIAGGGYTCGALVGGCMALNCFVGRKLDEFANKEKIRNEVFPLNRKLADRFEEEYGTGNATCAMIHAKNLGRFYDLFRGEGDREAFEAVGGHDVCSVVCGKAAVWTIEILEESGLI